MTLWLRAFDDEVGAFGTHGWVDVPLPAAGGGGLPFQGTWSSGVTYEPDEWVVRNSHAYQAINQNIANDPAIDVLAAPTLVGQSVTGTTDNFGAASAFGFTVNANTTISQVAVLVAVGTPATAGDLIGIASDWGNSATIPWLGKGAVGATVSGWIQVVLDTPVSLVTSTVYRLAATNQIIADVAAATNTGIIATVTDNHYGVTYQNTIDRKGNYRLYEAAATDWVQLW